MDKSIVLIITTEKDHSAQILKEFKPDKVSIVLYDDLSIINNEINYIDKPFRDLLNSTTKIILRDPYNSGSNYEYLLQKILKDYYSFIYLDKEVLVNFPNYEDKLFQANFFKKLKLNTPKTIDYKKLSTLQDNQWPIIMKKRISSRNKGNFIVKNVQDINKYLHDQDINDYIFQEIIDFDTDIRIIVCKNSLIGAIKREVIKNNSKYKLKVLNEQFEVPEKIEEQCLYLAKNLGADLLGIDIILKSNKFYFIEANVSPQFKKFIEGVGVKLLDELL